MGRVSAVLCFILVATWSDAEINPQMLTLGGINDCLKEAIGTNSVDDNGSVIMFSCSAAKAKVLFSFLGRKVRATVVQDLNGKFENRPFGDSVCYHRVEDQSGKAADEFRCDLIMTIGDVLRD